MAEREATTSASASAVHGRAPPPRVALAGRGVAIGLRWSGVEGAGNQILAAKLDCGPERARLVRIWRPFVDAPGRRDVVSRFAIWLAEEARWAEGRLVVGVDFALSLAETHLRQLGLLRQALRGPAVLGRKLTDRFVGTGGDFTEAPARFRAELGRDRARAAHRRDDRDGDQDGRHEDREPACFPYEVPHRGVLLWRRGPGSRMVDAIGPAGCPRRAGRADNRAAARDSSARFPGAVKWGRPARMSGF